MLKNQFKQNIFYLLLSAIYNILTSLRNNLYEANILKSKSIDCPVISIGNITTGGTGKTPIVQFISLNLVASGKKVAIISRGYKRESKGFKLVTDGLNKPLNWKIIGDEPYLLAQNLKNIPIAVDSSKFRAGKILIDKFSPDVILLDDGFQHRKLNRDLDIVLINSKDKLTDYKLLPSGNLREKWNNISRADIIVLTKSNIYKPDDDILTMIANDVPFYKSTISIDNVTLYPENNIFNIDILKNKNVFIFSAIGDFMSFYRVINKSGANILGKKEYLDHYPITKEDLQEITREALTSGAEALVSTEKDYVKILNHKLDMPLFITKLSIEILEEESLLKKIKAVI